MCQLKNSIEFENDYILLIKKSISYKEKNTKRKDGENYVEFSWRFSR